MQALGVGCFWFTPKQSPESISPSTLLMEIKSALEAIDNVSKVEIEGDGTHVNTWSPGGPYFISIDPKNCLPHNPQDIEEKFYPIYASAKIKFDIYVPQRLQEKFGRGFGTASSEHFHVQMRYEKRMPVTYIFYESSDEENYFPDATAPVVFVREYLKEKLSQNSIVEFRTLGPSPAHIKFLLGF